MNRYVKIMVIGLVLVVFLAGATLATLFGMGWSKDTPPTIVSTSVAPADSLHIGETITGKIVVKLPWYRRPVRTPQFDLPDGVEPLGSPQDRLIKLNLTGWYWETVIRLRPTEFLDNKTVAGKLFFTADRQGKSSPLDVTLTLPEIIPRDLEETTPLVSVPAVAGEDPHASHTVGRLLGLIALGLVIVAVVIIVVFVIFKKKGLLPTPPPPPAIWEIAERELSALERALPMEADVFFLKLTDTLRRYIEVRFNTPATERTTPEFLEDTKHAGWLTQKQRLRLTDVLTSADKAKFARASATLREMSKALDHAARFVGETRHQPGQSAQIPEVLHGPPDSSHKTPDKEEAGP